MVGAVRQRHHVGRKRHGRAAGTSARRPAAIIGVQRRAEDGIVGVRAKTEFRHIGLADEDGPGLAQPCHHRAISFRDMVAEERRALGGRQARHVLQVFHGNRQAVQGTDGAAARQDFVMLPRFGHQAGAVDAGDDGVDLRVHRIDPVEEGFHDRLGGALALRDLGGERGGGQAGWVG